MSSHSLFPWFPIRFKIMEPSWPTLDLHGMLHLLAPALLVSMGYIDPGKWAACIDSGARFGGDLVAFLLAFNFVAILCQCLSAHISIICGKNLAQVCREQFDKPTCIFLAVQAELSLILLNLTMILGISNALHMILGVDLFSSVLLTAVDAVLYPVFSTLMGTSRGSTSLISVGGITFICYVLWMLTSLPGMSVSPITMPSNVKGESIYALMSLLGANIMPHNFYLHSSIALRFQARPNASEGPRTPNNIIVIFSIFGGIFLVNCMLMNSASNIFRSTGLILLTFQDAMSLAEQAFRTRIGSVALFLLMFSSNHVTNLSWEIKRKGGSSILYDFFEIDLPWWLQCATIRIFGIIPALLCVWFSGAEGMYQMLIFSQVVMALLLPASVFPLYRIASCGILMSVNKISSVTEFLVLLCFMGMVGLKVVFLVELVFGESVWVGSLNWSMGTGISVPYVILIIIGCVWLCFTIRLLSTPLKCLNPRPDARIRNWEKPLNESELYSERVVDEMINPTYHEGQHNGRTEKKPSSQESCRSSMAIPSQNSDYDLPDTIIGTEPESHLPAIEENTCIKESLVSSVGHSEQWTEPMSVAYAARDATDVKSLAFISSKDEAQNLVERTLRMEGEAVPENEEEGSTWEGKGSSNLASKLNPSGGLEDLGTGLTRSLGVKADEGGSGAGSLSRLSGLGRAARRQLAAVLDEFWGQLYDLHGDLTEEAKNMNLKTMFGLESSRHHQFSAVKIDPFVKDFGGDGPFQLVKGVGRGSLMVSSGLYDVQTQIRLQSGSSIGSPYGVRKGSAPSLRVDEMQVLDYYLQRSGGNALDNLERRYSSLRLPPPDGLSYQPATLHGYQLPSYLNRIARDHSDYSDGQKKYSSLKYSSMGSSNTLREPPGFSRAQRTMNGNNSIQSSPTFHNNLPSRNTAPQSDWSNTYDLHSPRAAENNVVSQINAKKYHSSPNISRLSLPLKELYLSDKYSQFGGIPNNISTGTGQTFTQPSLDQTCYLSMNPRIGAGAPGSGELTTSPSNPYRDSLSRLNGGPSSGSLWNKLPFEQYGMANDANDAKTSLGTEGSLGERDLGNHGLTRAPLAVVDAEVKLLLSFRQCVLKLLKLEGSEWLFRQNDGADEELIDHVAMRERFIYEAEVQNMKKMSDVNDSSQYLGSVPNCGEGCVWNADLIVSFGVWCIHRILELSLMESRPELWGKYTYVLNHLQGIIEAAFFKGRSPKYTCFCLQIPASYQQRLNRVSRGSPLPPAAKLPRGKFTTAPILLELIKDVETAINGRKGRAGTAAGDVAFPKGKENLSSVLKRYKRKLSNKPAAAHESGGGRKA